MRSASLVAIGLILGLSSIGCESSAEVCRVAAPLSRIVLYEKDDFLGRWEHTAIVEDPGGSTAEVGAMTAPREVEWLFYEDRLVATEGVDPDAPVVAFAIEGHYTEGTFANGDVCIVSDERSWYERTHARIDWSMEHAAAPHALPIGPTESAVEPVPYSFEPDEIVWEWPARERDADGRLVAIDLVAHYWLDCVDCERLPIEITHRFERVD